MSKRFSGIVCGFLIAMLATSAISYAAQKTDILNIVYRDIKLKIEEELITPRDASGNIVEPFISDGTTYLPVRAVAEALNRDVSWENKTSTVVISGKPLKELRLTSQIPFSMNRTRFDVYKSGNFTRLQCYPVADSIDMSGWYDFSEKIVYDLGGKAEKFTGTLNQPKITASAAPSARIKAKIILRNEKDEVLLETEYVAQGDSALPFEADVSGCEKLSIEITGATTAAISGKSGDGRIKGGEATIAISNPTLYSTDY